MSIVDQIPLLEALSELDEKLRVADSQVKEGEGGLLALTEEVRELDDKLTGDRASIEHMEKTRGELIGEVRQMKLQLDKSREKLARSRNERESMAAQREAAELRRLIRDREIEAEKLNNIADQARTSVEQADARRTEVQAELDGSSEGAKKSIEEAKTSRAELLAQREEAVKRLPPVLYRRYEGIRQRKGKALAQTSNGTCNGCHIAVPPMMFQEMMKRTQFEQCPNCRRILYYVPPVAKED